MTDPTVPAGDLLLTDAEEYFDRVVKARRWTGRRTYGGGLEHRDPQYQWQAEALAEALDLAQYLAAQCRRLEDEVAAARAETVALRDEIVLAAQRVTGA